MARHRLGVVVAGLISFGNQAAFAGIPGDVAPDGNGDGRVSLIDWLRMGRLIVGLDEITGLDEFRRADCAPRASAGDGVMNAGDWVQVGRYMSGLDPLNGTGLAVQNRSLSEWAEPVGPFKRRLRLSTSELTNSVWTISLLLEGEGNENALSFSLHFDPRKQSVLGYTNHSDGALNINLKHKVVGDVGIALGLGPNQTFRSGTSSLMSLSFLVDASFSGTTEVEFRDWPAANSLSDPVGQTLECMFLGTSIAAAQPFQPRLEVKRVGAIIEIFWPVEGSAGFLLERANRFYELGWSAVPEEPTVVDGWNHIVHRFDGESACYRLRKP